MNLLNTSSPFVPEITSFSASVSFGERVVVSAVANAVDASLCLLHAIICKVFEIVLFNMRENTEGIVCDALKLVLLNKQEIFFDPSFLGINVGGSDVEELWINNQKERFDPVLTIINF
ncbi:hypothetical protein A3844_09370 [Paenibacillus helianthi]|uniref:Uncharacterized protein n=1 Tax=Paenibacillus helianthi TaxID=1349432 RepID=A0ABX3ETM2_9BACL|nr:hypothetical protein [Paenibacillus helianthi]OKP88008.1 hypothetical protein A3844_09370 [Paenibacillus helianthi]